LRAFNDHIARCYINNFSDDNITKEINKAESHIVRIILDCYKYSVAWYYDYFNKFHADFNVSLIDNGEFIKYFYGKQLDGEKTLRKAKYNESYNKQLAYNLYQETYNIYSELYIKIDEYLPKIQWARKIGEEEKKKKLSQNILSTIISTIVSAIISAIITYFYTIKS